MHTTVTEESISELVEKFYAKVHDDQLLGPIFSKAIGSDWGPHLIKMKSFWSSLLLTSKTYRGNPMLMHLQLPRLTQEHFDRWLGLWRETARQLCSANLAALFIQRAEVIGERLLSTISLHHSSLVGASRLVPIVG